MTSAKSLDKALHGWTVLRIISLDKRSPFAHCEVCGTRFRVGAIMRHRRYGLKISVGGVCAEMIHLATLRPGTHLHTFRSRTWHQFDDHYENKITRGSWLVWLTKNAPPRYASIIADLRYFRATRSAEDMEKLIKYHDKKRLYPVKALLDRALLRRLKWPQVPKYMTLDAAKKIMDRIKAKYPYELEVQAAQVIYGSKVKRHLDEEVQSAWEHLSLEEKRTALALIKIRERNELELLEKQEKKYDVVRRDGSWPIFVWNYRLGLCIVKRADFRPPDTARPTIYPGKRPLKSYYALSYFKSLRVLDKEDVGLLEEIAGSD